MDFLFGFLSGVLVPIVGIAYQQGWIPPKYHTPDSHPCKDPCLAKIFGTDDSPRRPQFIIRYMIPKYEHDGFKIVRLAFGREFRFGREIVWTGKVSDGSIKETVLMAKPAAA